MFLRVRFSVIFLIVLYCLLVTDLSGPRDACAVERAAVQSLTLIVEMDGFTDDLGKVRIALFDGPEGYPFKPEQAMLREQSAILSGKARVTFEGLSPGTYALSVFHDRNDNGRLDMHWFGPPSEAVGASNNAKGFIGPPDFKSASFLLDRPRTLQTIRLVKIF